MSEDYPGQAFFHKHNPNIKATEERAMTNPTSRDAELARELPDERLSKIINGFIDVPSCEPTRFNKFFHEMEGLLAQVRLEEAEWITCHSETERIERLLALRQAAGTRIEIKPTDLCSKVHCGHPASEHNDEGNCTHSKCFCGQFEP